jgi:aarF domain-containing kinase
VHQASVSLDGRLVPVAVKVQFPGVAESIDSDLANLKRLGAVTGVFPRGLFIDRIIQVMSQELREECDYEREAAAQGRFRALLADDRASFFVPRVVPHLSRRRVLTTELARGVPLDRAAEQPQRVRDGVGRKLLRLTLRELFEFREMQTDPNFSNYLYDDKLDRIVLLDFGATRAYPEHFVDDYLELVWAASNGDRQRMLDYSVKLGFLTGQESLAMTNAHIEAGLEVARPFQRAAPFDFRASRLTDQVGKHGDTFMKERLTPPPREVYSLHRKLSGAYTACIKLGAVFPCRDLLEATYYARRPRAAA